MRFCKCYRIIAFVFCLLMISQYAFAEKMRVGFVETADSSVNLPDIVKKNLKEAVRQGLVNSGKFEVVDRNEQDLKKLFEEMKFSDERIGRVDTTDEKKAEYGKIAGMEYLALLNVNEFFSGQEASKFQTMNAAHKDAVRIGANLRLINTSTGKIVLEKSVTAKRSVDVGSSSMQEVSMNKEGYEKSSLEKAADKIEDVGRVISGKETKNTNPGWDSNGVRKWQMNTELANKTIKSVAQKVVTQVLDELYPITILERSGTSAFINRGEDCGIKAGDILDVFAVRKVTDEGTQEEVSLAHPLGKIKIISVTEKTAQAEITEDFGVEKGCIAKRNQSEEEVTVESIKKDIDNKVSANDW